MPCNNVVPECVISKQLSLHVSFSPFTWSTLFLSPRSSSSLLFHVLFFVSCCSTSLQPAVTAMKEQSIHQLRPADTFRPSASVGPGPAIAQRTSVKAGYVSVNPYLLWLVVSLHRKSPVGNKTRADSVAFLVLVWKTHVMSPYFTPGCPIFLVAQREAG